LTNVPRTVKDEFFTKSQCYPLLLTLRNLHARYEPSMAIGSRDELRPKSPILGLPPHFRMQ
jgi:hypothetical protein